MAGKRFWIAQSPYDTVPTLLVQTASGGGVLEVGMIAKFSSNGSPYAIPCVDADHTIGTDTAMYGLVSKSSTHTSGDDGVVEIYKPLPGIEYRGYATTAANIDTKAKLDALLGDRVTIDVSATTSAGDWTIDEDDGEGQTKAFQMLKGDKDKGTIDFLIRSGATYLADQDLA